MIFYYRRRDRRVGSLAYTRVWGVCGRAGGIVLGLSVRAVGTYEWGPARGRFCLGG
jgi:hypothetical protein